eukprot:CAMPEP_0119065054 /NCGR_PEP_ID=MMETSP1178-20130426/7965_1 /TAXON_ID=33656 /ORGANISM="unid sp, Strain CCMP2000" /LENGTH=87 /DNA_ID=CAMNT_0007046539 /DNA_START=27 /DNA_END=286 /DNA_ORIENTATION=-
MEAEEATVEAAAAAVVEVSGSLKGRVMCEDCYWVLEDESDGGRAVQVVLAKANSFTRWDGVLVGEVNLEQAEFLSQERNLDPEFAAR